MKNSICFSLKGRYGLFSDPLSKGGEKFSYQIPTYQALIGVCESIYWKPTIMWHIDRMRVMKPIRTQPRNVRPIEYGGGNTLAIYTYLSDVEYQVEAHFEWNLFREDLTHDRNENKHYFIAKRMLERGGRCDIFLGTRECQGYVEPMVFGEGTGFYDHYGELPFGVMFHGFNYPSLTGVKRLDVRLWRPIMRDGIVEFIRPDECDSVRQIRSMGFDIVQTIGTDEEGLLDGYEVSP